MRALIAALVCAAGLNSFSVDAQDACPCVPLSHLWIVKTCTDWTCASTELAAANGDPQVMAVPVGLSDTRWIVRRFAAGTAVDSSKYPFRLEQFNGMSAAVERYTAIDYDHQPKLFTAPDGQVLVISLREPEPRRRAIPHP